ncbi:MAG: hypothetical protein IJC78_07775 [Clostridia bacterium]|nr:hypothetical protein [Clostridia bacterium]
MTKVVISFDTEDYVNPLGADGILRTAQVLQSLGVRGCYNIVAWLAQALVKWERTDVLEALKYHETETHSLRHSYHPTICEYTDIEDFDEALRQFRQNEDEALTIIQDILGNDAFYAACPPGDSVSYVARYGYADMGIPIYDGDFLYDAEHGRPVSCSNILCMEYNFSMDCFLNWDKEQILEKIEEMANFDTYIAYHHPQKNAVVEFCDLLNFYRKNIEGEWILSTPLPAETTEEFMDNFRFFIEKLIEDPRFEIVTYEDIAKEYAGENRVIRPSDMPMLQKALAEEFFPVTVPDSFSLSDMMLACRDFLMGKEAHTCEKVYGFLDTPFAISQPVTVTAEEMKESANQIKDGAFLPAGITVGDKKLGPADWLRAAMQIVCGKESATVVPDKWQIDLNQFPRLRDQNLVGSWVHAEDFKDQYISDRSRLQAWTIRLPKGTSRKIFA